MKKRPPFNSLGNSGGGEELDPREAERLAREMLGTLYRFRRLDKQTTASGALDVLQSVLYSIMSEPERMIRLAAWSEANEAAMRGILPGVTAPIFAGRATPVLWDADIRLAAEHNAAAFAEHPLDRNLVMRSGGMDATLELWIDVDQPRFYPVDAMGITEEMDEAELLRRHDEWWELPEIGAYAPIGMLLMPVQTSRPMPTTRGAMVKPGSVGLMAIFVFAPILPEGAPMNESGLPVHLDARSGEPTGPTLVLRALEAVWEGQPVPPFYSPLVAARWFLGEKFIESGRVPVPPEKEREVAALASRLVPDAKGAVGAVRYVRFRKAQSTASKDGESEEQRWGGWWFVRGHVRRVASGPVWVKGYAKGDRSGGYIGRGEVRKADR